MLRGDDAKLVALAALLAVVFAGAALAACGGRPSLPLDDSFIYLQYARQLAHGRFFEYQDGDGPSSGATAPLQVVLLAPAFGLGLDGLGACVWAWALGALCLAGTLVVARRLARDELGPGWPARLFPLLVGLNGCLLWGTLSGMEVALSTLLLLAFVWQVLRAAGALPAPWLLAAGLALSVCRPEGLAAVLIGLVFLFRQRGTPRALRLRSLVLPLPGVAFFVWNRLATGSWMTTSMEAKTLFRGGPADALRAWLSSLASVFEQAFVLPSTLTFPPGAFLLFLAGGVLLLRRELGRKRSGAGVFVAAILATGLSIGAGSDMAPWQRSRYQMAYFPLLLLAAVALFDAFEKAGPRGRRAARALAAVYVAVSLLCLPIWAGTFARDCAAILGQHVAVAEEIRERLPPDAVIGTHDIGAIAYLSGRRVVDLIGLVTPGRARALRTNPAAAWRSIYGAPPGRRPTHLAVYDDWAGGRAPLFGSTVTFSDILGGERLAVYAVAPSPE